MHVDAVTAAGYAMFRWHVLTHRELWCDDRPFIHRESCIKHRWLRGYR
jgi:hypothetical protein